ncbi:hypothetical protein BDB01DRAFT_727145 [Pilobolus umbonatus]|nr:hypothetical protein BDB01DRAFT_727145 [Pilobolus umbonatus]
MAEREFQNMFTFCRGFEAASLKWHCKDQEDDSSTSNSLGGKKQMIGFARFRTRLEALEAIEVLSGKKVDQEKGTVLKAEMAKKNLHIKRGSATQTSTSTSSSTSTSTTATVPPTAEPGRPFDSFSPLPRDLLSNDYKNDFMLDNNNELFGLRSHSFDQDLSFISSRAFSLAAIQPYTPPPRLPSLLDEEPYHYLSKSTPVPMYDDDMMRSLLSDLRPSSSNNRTNLADQNPPCNTLYVGNLPPNTSEEELRHLFSICKGYRRMCFRTKPQGPMCFVEFEDIPFASHALNELQGHTLSNSVKGGIRLSFSKNPLFIKPNKENVSFKQMGNMLMTDKREFMFDPQL